MDIIQQLRWLDFKETALNYGLDRAKWWALENNIQPSVIRQFIDTYNKETGQVEKPSTLPKDKTSQSYETIESCPQPEPSESIVEAQDWLDGVCDDTPATPPVPKEEHVPGWKSKTLQSASDYKMSWQQVEHRYVIHTLWYHIDRKPQKSFTVADLVKILGKNEDTVALCLKEMWQQGMIKGRVSVKENPDHKGCSSAYYEVTSLMNTNPKFFLDYPEDNILKKGKKKT